MHQQSMIGLDQGPGLTPQGGHRLAEGEIGSLNEGSLDQTGQADRFEFDD